MTCLENATAGHSLGDRDGFSFRSYFLGSGMPCRWPSRPKGQAGVVTAPKCIVSQGFIMSNNNSRQ